MHAEQKTINKTGTNKKCHSDLNLNLPSIPPSYNMYMNKMEWCWKWSLGVFLWTVIAVFWVFGHPTFGKQHGKSSFSLRTEEWAVCKNKQTNKKANKQKTI